MEQLKINCSLVSAEVLVNKSAGFVRVGAFPLWSLSDSKLILWRRVREFV